MTLLTRSCWIAVALLGGLVASSFGQQWDSSGDDLYYNGGKVGVGTVPSADVQVQAGSANNRAATVKITGPHQVWDASFPQVMGDLWFGSAEGGAAAERVAGIRTLATRDFNTDQYGAEMRFYTTANNDASATERVRITQDGDVGLGEKNPEEKLHIRDASNRSRILLEGESGTSATTGIGIRSLGTRTWQLGVKGSKENGAFIVWNATLGNRALTVASDNDVGIGTKSPGEKLAVNGNVLAKEVIVDPNQIPDYVFAEHYDLPTLEEVSAFIDEQGHLPSVPSAKSVKKNGLRLGEMDATLLRKVEELTLYAIEQKRQADSLNTRLNEHVRRLRRENGQLRKDLREERRARRRRQQRHRQQLEALRREVQKLKQRVSSGE